MNYLRDIGMSVLSDEPTPPLSMQPTELLAVHLPTGRVRSRTINIKHVLSMARRGTDRPHPSKCLLQTSPRHRLPAHTPPPTPHHESIKSSPRHNAGGMFFIVRLDIRSAWSHSVTPLSLTSAVCLLTPLCPYSTRNMR
ncbi:hypothetical protein J6590_028348 [Homalodisca vitripennis]|nr:hypothetical protein J6590_028348 [Homalodisca vitripennis]